MKNNSYNVLRSILTIFIILICNSSISAQSGSQMVVSFRETGDSVDFSDFPDFSAIYITSDIPNLVVKSGVSLIYRTMTGPNKELIIVTPTEQKLEFEAEGYRSVIVDIPPMRPRQVVWLHVERVLPKPIPGKLTVTTRPSGADVVLSGIQKSYKTPTTIDSLVAGVYSMRISLNAYESYNQQVVINEGEVAVVDVTLQPIYGKITVVTSPPGAVFWLSGNSTYYRSPGSINDVVPGTYNLNISMDGYEPYYDRKVEISAGVEQVIDVALVKKQVVVEKPTVVEPPAQTPRSQTTSQSQKDLEGSAKNDDNNISTGMVRRPSHGAAIALSVVIPGAGQIYSKRGIGWLWVIASVGSAGYSAYYYQEKASLTKAYESAYSSYLSAQSVELARQYRSESEAQFQALNKAHNNMINGFRAFAAVYVLQLLDAAIITPKPIYVTDNMSVRFGNGSLLKLNYKL
jgi:hypothetical protein